MPWPGLSRAQPQLRGPGETSVLNQGRKVRRGRPPDPSARPGGLRKSPDPSPAPAHPTPTPRPDPSNIGGPPLRGLDLRSISAHQAAVAAGTRGAARAPSPRRPGPPPRAAAPPRVHRVPGAATGAARHLLCFRGAAPASIVSAAAAAAAVAVAAAAGPGAGVGAAGVGAPSAASPGLGLGSGLGLGRHRPTGSEARGGLCARRARRADTTPRGGAARGERCHSCRPHHTPCPPRAGRGPGARARGRRRAAGVGRGAQAQSAGARAHTGACRPAPRPRPKYLPRRDAPAASPHPPLPPPIPSPVGPGRGTGKGAGPRTASPSRGWALAQRAAQLRETGDCQALPPTFPTHRHPGA